MLVAVGSGVGVTVVVMGPVTIGPTISQRLARALGEKSVRL